MLWRCALTLAVAFSVIALVGAAADLFVPRWWFIVLAVAWVVAAVKWPDSDPAAGP